MQTFNSDYSLFVFFIEVLIAQQQGSSTLSSWGYFLYVSWILLCWELQRRLGKEIQSIWIRRDKHTARTAKHNTRFSEIFSSHYLNFSSFFAFFWLPRAVAVSIVVLKQLKLIASSRILFHRSIRDDSIYILQRQMTMKICTINLTTFNVDALKYVNSRRFCAANRRSQQSGNWTKLFLFCLHFLHFCVSLKSETLSRRQLRNKFKFSNFIVFSLIFLLCEQNDWDNTQ